MEEINKKLDKMAKDIEIMKQDIKNLQPRFTDIHDYQDWCNEQYYSSEEKEILQ